MIVEAATIDVTQYTVQYELLRSQVIDPTGNSARGRQSCRPSHVAFGLALLLSEGMPGWLKTVEAVIRTALAPRVADSRDPAPQEGSPPSSATPVWLSSVRHQVTTLLASLVLSTRPVAHPIIKGGIPYMLMDSGAQKVTTAHLSRLAYLYVRQSTLRQVLENTESTHRQYALQGRAVALGWPLDRVVVIDSDLGQSGASAADREGFQRLVTEVSLARVGIVLGLEVSRLARNSTDWHRLLELCALADTLILDEDGLL